MDKEFPLVTNVGDLGDESELFTRHVDLVKLDPGNTMRFTVEPVIEEEVPGTPTLNKRAIDPRVNDKPQNKESKDLCLSSVTEKDPLLPDNNNDEVFEKETNIDNGEIKRESKPERLRRTLSLNVPIQSREKLNDSVRTSASNTTAQAGIEDSYLHSIQEAGKNFGKSRQRTKERLIDKGGDVNLTHVNFDSRNKNFFIDIFTTLVDMKWRYNVLMFTMGFVSTWIGFGIIWWIILLIHQDHKHVDDPDWQPCMAEVYDFTTALLFSLETQHTIGYGSRSMHPGCPPAIIVLMAQSITGVFVQSLMTGVIFAKLARPKRRSHTIIFSDNAVICMRDGDYCLLFRVGDMRSNSLIINSSVRAIMFKNRTTKESELIPLCQFPLEVETETSLVDTYAFMIAPVTVMHKIEKKSPFWNISPEKLVAEKFEIVVIMEGTIESTGMTTQLRTSYLPTEIKWGHLLQPLVTHKRGKGYEIDHGLFHGTEPQEGMPFLSAEEYSRRNAAGTYNNISFAPLANFTLPTKLQSASADGRGAQRWRKMFNMVRTRSNSSPITGKNRKIKNKWEDEPLDEVVNETAQY